MILLKTCEWCKQEVNRTLLIDNLGNRYTVCLKCFNTYKSKICRKCGGPLGRHSIKGICLGCKQLNEADETKQRDEIQSGVELKQLQRLTNGTTTFTEDDYNNWVTMGQGNFKKIDKYSKDKQFIINRFKADKIWNKENINDYIEDIISLLDRHTDKLTKSNLHIIRIEDIVNFIGAKIVDKENKVLLILG